MARWQLSAWPTPLLTLLPLTVCVRVSVCSLYVACFGSLRGPGEGVMGPVALLQDPFEDEKLVSPIKVPATHSQKVCR